MSFAAKQVSNFQWMRINEHAIFKHPICMSVFFFFFFLLGGGVCEKYLDFVKIWEKIWLT